MGDRLTENQHGRPSDTELCPACGRRGLILTWDDMRYPELVGLAYRRCARCGISWWIQ